MQGFAFKTSVFIIVSLLSALTFANSDQKKQTKTATYNSGAGCMACHQAEATPVVKKTS